MKISKNLRVVKFREEDILNKLEKDNLILEKANNELKKENKKLKREIQQLNYQIKELSKLQIKDETEIPFQIDNTVFEFEVE